MEWTYTVGNRLLSFAASIVLATLFAWIVGMATIWAIGLVALVIAAWSIILWKMPNLPPPGYH